MRSRAFFMLYFMKDLNTLFNGKQIYENYSAEDHQVWSLLLENQRKNFRYLSTDYLNCVDELQMADANIPNYEFINKHLMQKTSWSVFGVPEIVEIADFLKLMDKRQFPATTWIRSMRQINYIEEPDMFHDGFGHIPLLANPSYANFLWELGQIGLKYSFSQRALDIVQRVYWYTIEFGLIEERGELKAYGAGLISSEGELINSLSSNSQKLHFDLKRIGNSPFRTDIFQNKYFVINSFEELYNSIPDLERFVSEEIGLRVE